MKTCWLVQWTQLPDGALVTSKARFKANKTNTIMLATPLFVYQLWKDCLHRDVEILTRLDSDSRACHFFCTQEPEFT